MKLTRLPPRARYIALSYTWGKVTPPFQTKTDNIRNLLVSGGLRKWMNDIPRTIRDAINLVVDLGERYLWVDSLCIIQDTDRSWALNSRVMDVVYGKAYLTICAADGNNSNAGLRGLHNSTSSGNTRHFSQNIAQYNRNSTNGHSTGRKFYQKISMEHARVDLPRALAFSPKCDIRRWSYVLSVPLYCKIVRYYYRA
jgi:hypothetical protein